MSNKPNANLVDELIEIIQQDLGELNTPFLDELLNVIKGHQADFMYLEYLNKELRENALSLGEILSENLYEIYKERLRKLVDVLYEDLRDKGISILLLEKDTAK